MKKLFALLLAGIMVFSMAACGEKTPSDPQDPSAGGDKQPGAEEITIAFIGNTTGDYAMYGVPVRNSVMMFFEQLNAQGGINGKKVNVLEYDDKADGIEAKNAYNLAVSRGATAILGSVLTAPTIALADSTYADNTPQVTASATNPGVTRINPADESSEVRTNVFRTCFLDPFQGEKMIQYAATELNAKTVAVFYQTGSDYSESILTGIESKAAEYNIEIVDKEAFSEGDKDYKAQMTNIASKNPDVVLMPIYYGEAGLAITALRAAGCTAQVIGGDGFGSVKDYATAEDLEGTLYFSGYAPGTESVAQFEADYEAKYGEAVPNMFAPLAWDAALVLAEGIRQAEAQGLTAGTDEYKQAIIDAIAALDGFEGITGSYVFNEYNDPDKTVAVIEVTGGEELFKNFY